MTLSRLTDKQARFIEEYLLCNSAYQAAKKAGFAESTADKKSYAWVGESRDDCPANMRHVWDAVQEAKKARSERTKIDADYVLQRHAEIDQMDFMDIMDDEGHFKKVSQWPKIWRQFLSGIDIAEIWEGRGDDKAIVGMLKKIKWPDKLKNLELLGKHVSVGAYSEKLVAEHDVRVTEVRRTIVKPGHTDS